MAEFRHIQMKKIYENLVLCFCYLFMNPETNEFIWIFYSNSALCYFFRCQPIT